MEISLENELLQVIADYRPQQPLEPPGIPGEQVSQCEDQDQFEEELLKREPFRGNYHKSS
jgi:hypothetical protein